MQGADQKRREAGVARVAGGASAVALAFLFGCNGGVQKSEQGVVSLADVCPTVEAATVSGSACPLCSSLDGAGLCRDRYYAHAVRCTDEHDTCQKGGGACNGGYCVFTDKDKNGLDDDFEREIAEQNLPRLYMDPDESCGAPRGIVYRVRRHPDRPGRVSITYVVLYEVDCGALNGHLGDNEAFAITVDLDAAPGGPATVGVVSDAHRNTACESVSTCETRPGTSACAGDGGRVAIFSSRDKHANYLDIDTCEGNCLDHCGKGPVDESPVLVDVGEADAPLCTDLSSGPTPLTNASAWDPVLVHFNPWSQDTFADAGHIRDQLENLVAPAGL